MYRKLWSVLRANLAAHWAPILTAAVVAAFVGVTFWPAGNHRRVTVERDHWAPPVGSHRPLAAAGNAPPPTTEAKPAPTGSAAPATPSPVRSAVPPPASQPNAQAADAPAWDDPLRGPLLLPFGWVYSPTYADWRYHPGVDLAATVGTPVRAVRGGQVARVTRNRTWKDEVTVVSPGGWQVVYADLGSAAVWPGQEVAAGQVVGAVGLPGGEEMGEGPHLHLEVKQNGVPVNPAAEIPGIS